jgi:excisionase family DNA binding protein
MQQLLLRPAEAARMLGLGRSKVYEMAATREIPAIRIGRAVRIPASALRQWVEEQQEEQAAP